MKKIDRYINKIPITAGITLLLAISGFTSCLKNSNNYIDFSTEGASVDLPLAAANNNTVVSFSYTAVPSASIPFYINLASPHTLGIAVTATFALDTAFLNNYNATNPTNYQLMPDSDYTVLNGWNRTIPAGQRSDSMYVKFDFTKIDPSQSYVLPVTIQTASVPIEQWNHLMISPSVRNKYDGNYTLKIETIGWTAYGIADGVTAIYPDDFGLVTASATAVTTTNFFAGPFQPVFSGTAGVPGTIGPPTEFGATTPEFVFDLATDKITDILNTSPDDGRGRFLIPNPAAGINNHYDPSTKTIYAAYIMKQNGRPNQQIYDTLIYRGPRP